jgi:hypothetical protein
VDSEEYTLERFCLHILDAIDCYPREAAAKVGSAINQVRQIWSFLGPFGSRQCTNCGIGNAAGFMAGMIVGAALIPPISLKIFRGKWRRSTSNPDDSVSLVMPSEPVVAMASTSASGMDNAKGLAQQIERLPSDS